LLAIRVSVLVELRPMSSLVLVARSFLCILPPLGATGIVRQT
jgi:hypothetical protein